MTEQGENAKPSASGSNKRRDAKIMKRAKTAWEAIIAGLGNSSEDEKLKQIEIEYVKLYGDYCDANKESKLKDRTIQQYQKDYAQALAEIQKAVAARTRLENLARELQKQNKDIKVSPALLLLSLDIIISLLALATNFKTILILQSLCFRMKILIV